MQLAVIRYVKRSCDGASYGLSYSESVYSVYSVSGLHEGEILCSTYGGGVRENVRSDVPTADISGFRCHFSIYGKLRTIPDELIPVVEGAFFHVDPAASSYDVFG